MLNPPFLPSWACTPTVMFRANAVKCCWPTNISQLRPKISYSSVYCMYIKRTNTSLYHRIYCTKLYVVEKYSTVHWLLILSFKNIFDENLNFQLL